MVAAALLGVLFAAWRAWTKAPVDLQRLQRITRLLAMDPDLMWRQRPDLDTTFEGTQVWTDGERMRLATPPGDPARDRPRGRPEIVVFGASPTFGYGVEGRDAWPSVLEDRLREPLPGVRVRNAGQIGFSSWQGRRLVDQVIDDWAPDLVVIDYVVNDVERIRFFFPDGQEDGVSGPPSALLARVANAVRFFPPTGLLLEAVARLAVYLAPPMDPRRVVELGHVR